LVKGFVEHCAVFLSAIAWHSTILHIVCGARLKLATASDSC
jgi:hypothetical protein